MQAVGVGVPGNAGTPCSRTLCGVAVSDSLWRCCFRLLVALLFQTLCGVVVSDSVALSFQTLWCCRFRLCGVVVSDSVALSFQTLWRCRFRLQQHGGPAVHDAEPEPGDAHGGHALAAGDPRAAPVLPGLHGMQAVGSGPQGLAAGLR